MEVEIKQPDHLTVQVALSNFVILHTELLPEDVRDRVETWSDDIDYWAVDWDFQDAVFMQGWAAYRTRKERKLPLVSGVHSYEEAGNYKILVRAIDIFGNETKQAFQVELRRRNAGLLRSATKPIGEFIAMPICAGWSSRESVPQGSPRSWSKTWRLMSNSPLHVAGQRAELAVTPIGESIIRISVVPLDKGRALPIPVDGSLDPREWGPPLVRLTDTRQSGSLSTGRWRLTMSLEPLSIRIEAPDGRLLQQVRVNGEKGSFAFHLGDGPVLGLGEGGPQFDRRGSTDRMRSGQGGYRLRTHGGRVPIPWLIGTAGWAMFVHQPFGTFDLTGAEGRFTPAGRVAALPLDLFIVTAREPARDHGRVGAAHRPSRRCRRCGRSATSSRTARWPAARRSCRSRRRFARRSSRATR